MSKEKKIRYSKPALIRTIVLSSIVLLTMLMPIIIQDGVSYGEYMFGKTLFNGEFKLLIATLLGNMIESTGADAYLSTTLALIINIAVIVVMVIALIDLVLSIIALCQRNYNKAFRIVDRITMILLWVAFVAVTALFLFFLFVLIGALTQGETAMILYLDCPLYIILFISTLWLAILKCKLLKRHSFKA